MVASASDPDSVPNCLLWLLCRRTLPKRMTTNDLRTVKTTRPCSQLSGSHPRAPIDGCYSERKCSVKLIPYLSERGVLPYGSYHRNVFNVQVEGMTRRMLIDYGAAGSLIKAICCPGQGRSIRPGNIVLTDIQGNTIPLRGDERVNMWIDGEECVSHDFVIVIMYG